MKKGRKIIDEFSHLPTPYARNRARLQKLGLCPYCRRNKSNGFWRCEACREKLNANRRLLKKGEWHKTTKINDEFSHLPIKRRQIERRIRDKKCICCSSSDLFTKRHCKKCRDKLNGYRNKKRLRNSLRGSLDHGY